MYRDNFGVFWIGSYGKSINYLNHYQLKFKSVTKDLLNPNWLHNEYVFSFLETNKGLWVGTSGGAFYFYNNKTRLFEKFPDEFADDNRTTCIVEAGDNKIWIANGSKSKGKLILFDFKTKKRETYIAKPGDDKFLNHQRVKALVADTLNHQLWIATGGGGVNVLNTQTGKFKYYTRNESCRNCIVGNDVNDVFRDSYGNFWFATTDGLSYFNTKKNSFTNYKFNPADSNSLSNNYVLSVNEDSKRRIWVATSYGLNLFDKSKTVFKTFSKKDGLPDNFIYGTLEDAQGNLWISTNNGICRFNYDQGLIRNFDVSDGLQSKEFNTRAFHLGKSGKMYFGGINGYNTFYPSEINDNPKVANVLITGFKLFGVETALDTPVTYKKVIELNYNQNFLSFDFTSIDYLIPEKNQYAFKMEGLNDNWINLGNEHNATFTNLYPGKYTLKVKATNNDGVWNDNGVSIQIVINPPFWLTKTFYLSILIILVTLIILFIKWRERKIKKEKSELEIKIRERTFELVKERDKIITLNSELSMRKEEVESQKKLVERKNKEMLDSIEYAVRIQKALLPSTDFISNQIDSSFIYFKPKDIVSGDFYWATLAHINKEPIFYLLTGDCTGHGVPGAFMSLLNISYINEAVSEKNLFDTGLILDFIRAQLIKNLSKTDKYTNSVDGMDCAFFSINKNTLEMNYTSANNPVWIVREFSRSEPNHSIESMVVLNKHIARNGNYYVLFEGLIDKMPVGKLTDDIVSFNTYKVQLQKGDSIYTFTDGIADQFGGPRGKKFKYRQLEEMIIENACQPMDLQMKIYKERIELWMGNYHQLDDILFIGIKI
jgi:serine phosphatase RsbU (regulator of sigma subunit)/sugar lactone lactonase YvrE